MRKNVKVITNIQVLSGISYLKSCFFILNQDPVGQGCVPRRRKHDDQQDLENRNAIAAHVNSRLAQGSGYKAP